MPEPPADDLLSQVSAVALDVFHVAVGFGVLGVQRLQVERRQLEARLPSELKSVLRAVGERASSAVDDVRALVK